MASLMVTGICRLTRDAEPRKSANGTWFNMGVVSYRKNPKDGKQQEDFFEAEIYVKNPIPGYEKDLTKGKLIFIDAANLRNDKFTGNDGMERNKMKILIQSYELLENDVVPEKEAPKAAPAPEPAKKVDVPISRSTHPSDLPPPMAPKKIVAKEPDADGFEEGDIPAWVEEV